MTDVSLAEKIAAVERLLEERKTFEEEFGPTADAGDIPAAEAVLADLRAQKDEVSDAFDTDDNPFHEYIRSGVLKAIEAFRADNAGRAHSALATTARVAAAVLVEQARRAGAEQMRERMVSHYEQFKPDDLWTTERIIADIRALPVE